MFSSDELQKSLGFLNAEQLIPHLKDCFQPNYYISTDREPIRDIGEVAQRVQGFLRVISPILPTPSTTMHPNWKSDLCLKHMIWVSMECMFIGQDISCDEQDIGF